MLSLLSNIASLRSLRLLSQAVSRVESSYTRLSSGMRINRASDDAAGLSIASRLGLDSRVYTQAIRNGNDAVSALNIAGGTTEQLSSILIRMRELATQAANGTLSLTQRRSLNAESTALTNEYNRLVATTRFNNLSLFSSTTQVSAQLGYGAPLSVGIGTGLQRTVGTGAFHSAEGYGSSGNFNDVGTADFDGDGNLDMVQVTDGDSFLFFSGNGDGTFKGAIGYSLGGANLTSLAVGDVTGDGQADVVVGDDAGNVIFVHGVEDGTFNTGQRFGLTGSVGALELADFNSDGKLDLAIGHGSSISVAQNSGSVFALTAFTHIAGGTINDLAAGDFNADGKTDFASGGNTGVDAFLSTGTSFTTVSVDSSNRSAISVGDINGDGLDDIATIKATNSVAFYTSTGTAFTVKAQSITTIGSDVELVDLNGDGFLDVLTSDSATLLDGAGNTLSQILIGDGLPGKLAPGDFNQDGAMDFVSTDSSQFAYHQGTGTQSFNMEAVNLSTRAYALSAIGVIDSALQRVGKETGVQGASLNRLEAALSNLLQSRGNTDASRSRITDADIAEESSNLIKGQILQQAGVAILAQANTQPKLALFLLGINSNFIGGRRR